MACIGVAVWLMATHAHAQSNACDLLKTVCTSCKDERTKQGCDQTVGQGAADACDLLLGETLVTSCAQ